MAKFRAGGEQDGAGGHVDVDWIPQDGTELLIPANKVLITFCAFSRCYTANLGFLWVTIIDEDGKNGWINPEFSQKILEKFRQNSRPNFVRSKSFL